MAPSGDNGWGYDPVFLPLDHEVTMAQLSETEKNRISHRGIAAAKIRGRLRQLAQA
jgi:XTP/dITP diphosphohydrolase